MNNDYLVPQVPAAPDEYDPRWIERTIRDLVRVLEEMRETGPMRASTLFVSSLPKNGNQLRAGQVYNDAGTLKIASTNTRYAPTLVGTSALGTVTVVTT